MARNLTKRLDHVEDAMLVGDDRQQFERERRYAYNLRLISTEALDVSMLCILGGIPTPDWITAELERPIPPDANRSLVAKAEASARQILCDDSIASQKPAEALLDQSQIDDLFQTVSVFANIEVNSFEELEAWLTVRGDRPGNEYLYKMRDMSKCQ